MEQKLPTRKKTRLPYYDYSSNGVYFITICTHNKQCVLSSIDVGADIIRPPKIKLSYYGCVVDEAINSIPKHYDGVYVDSYVIMPNHIHLVIQIAENSGRIISAPTVIGSLKRYVSYKIGKSIWQKGFYDHIIRDYNDYLRILQYIDENPYKWTQDMYYPK